MEPVRRCSRCNEWKSYTEFYSDAHRKDGLEGRCKECSRRKSLAYRNAHREERIAYQHVWRAANTEAIKNYKAANAERRREWERAHYALNRLRVINRRGANRAKRAGVDCSLSPAGWLLIVDSFHGRCAYCNLAFSDLRPLTQDHVIPISLGGGHVVGNVVPACLDCNRAKSDQLWHVFMSRKGWTPEAFLRRLAKTTGEFPRPRKQEAAA